MKEPSHCTPVASPGATAKGEIVSISVDHNHPLLQLKRALPWEALCEIMTRHWRRAGKNTDGRPGLPWHVALYVPLVVLMLVKHLHARDMEAYVAENVVARVFIGRQDDPSPQIRDHANMARASAALSKEGVDESKALLLHVAKDGGFADPSILSSDSTAASYERAASTIALSFLKATSELFTGRFENVPKPQSGLRNTRSAHAMLTRRVQV